VNLEDPESKDAGRVRHNRLNYAPAALQNGKPKPAGIRAIPSLEILHQHEVASC
jgi:hypothetical protein